jgi:protein-tyrosine phosphatase
VFHPCTCGLRRSVVVVAAALIGYDHVQVAIGTTTRRR